MKYEWRMGADVNILSSLTLSKAQDNGAGALENQNGNFPAPQDINNLDADYGVGGLQPAVQQHDQLRVVAAVRQGQALGQRHVGGDGCPGRRLAAGRHQHDHAGRDGDAHLLAGGGVPGLRHHQRLLGRQQLPAEHHLRSVRRRHRRSRSWFNPSCVVAADRSEPAVRQRAAQQRPRTELLAVRSRGEQERRGSARAPSCSSGSRRSTCSTATTSSRRPRNRSAATFGTITTTYDARQLQLGLKVLW